MKNWKNLLFIYNLNFIFTTFFFTTSFFTALFLLHTSVSQAAERSSGSLFLNGYLGSPSLTLTNPDDSKAIYSGIGLKGQAGFAIFENPKFSALLMGVGRYLDLKNNANSSGTKEIGSHVGAGFGVQIEVFKLFFGVEYEYVLGRHYFVGPTSNSIEFAYTPMTILYGIRFQFGPVSLCLKSTSTSGNISSASAKLSKEVPVKDTAYWLGLSFRPNLSVGGILGEIFK